MQKSRPIFKKGDEVLIDSPEYNNLKDVVMWVTNIHWLDNRWTYAIARTGKYSPPMFMRESKLRRVE